MTQIDLRQLHDCISQKKLLDIKNDLVWKMLISRNQGFRHDLIKTYLHIDDDILGSEMVIPILLPSEVKSNTGMKKSLKALSIKDQSKVYITDATVRVTFRNKQGKSYTMIVFLEMQNYYDDDYLMRSYLYVAREESDQLKAGDTFDKVQPVAQIAFCGKNIQYLAGENEFISEFRVLSLNNPRLIIAKQSGRWVFVELNKLDKTVDNVTNKREAYALFIKDLINLTEREVNALIAKGGVHMEEVATDLVRLSLDPDARKVMQYYEKLGFDIGSMKSHSFIRGIAEGKAKGKAEGKAEGVATVAKRMLAAGHDISVISELTGLTPQEITMLAR